MTSPISPLRILMLAPFGIRPKGTLAVRMLPLAQALVRRGHHVHILAPPVHNPHDAGQCENMGGVWVEHTLCPTLRGPRGTVQQVLMLLAPTLQQRPDVIHLFKPKGYSGLAALLTRLIAPQIPLVLDTDDWEGWGGWNELLPYPYAAKMLFAWQEYDLPGRTDAVTVASRTLQTQVWGMGISPQHVFYLPNGTSPTMTMADSAVAAPDAPLTMVLYTRFWEFDVRDMVAVLVGVAQQCPTVRLRVIGTGERGEERQLVQLARRAGVGHMLECCGWVESSTIPSLLRRAHIALVPLDDTLINRARCSVKLLELMAAGLPIVASAVGEVTTYLSHEQSGLLVPPGNVGAFTAAALRLLHDAELRQRLALAARQSVTQFSWDILAPTAEQAYGCAISVTRIDTSHRGLTSSRTA